MKITYIHHSSFSVEINKCILLFDYYKGNLPKFDENKKLYVFSSHSHYDHFDKAIFDLEKTHPNVTYILSNDIHVPKKDNIKFMGANERLLVDDLEIKTLESSDLGVAFIVKVEDKTIYHAGDLNDWYWDGEPKADNQRLTSAYRAEIRKIKGMHFDAAFVPLDPRQGNHYADGILYFLKNVDCNVIFPMHYWNDANVIKRFITEYPQYKSRIKNTECAKGEEL